MKPIRKFFADANDSFRDLFRRRRVSVSDPENRLETRFIHISPAGFAMSITLEKVAEALNVEISELFVHRKTVETVPAFKCPHCGNKLYIEIKGEDYGEESF